jgi:hypothetical protein
LRLPITWSWTEVARIWLSAAPTTQSQKIGPGDGSRPTPAATSARRYTMAIGKPKTKRVNDAPLVESRPVRWRCSAVRTACADAATRVIGIQAMPTRQ